MRRPITTTNVYQQVNKLIISAYCDLLTFYHSTRQGKYDSCSWYQRCSLFAFRKFHFINQFELTVLVFLNSFV